MPVVDNLEDMWRVSKLQRERKAAEEAKKKAHLARMRVRHQRPDWTNALLTTCCVTIEILMVVALIDSHATHVSRPP